MSWDDGRIENKPCPCGKGHFTITYRSNDWGQHDERWEMHCAACARAHGLYRHSYMDRKGMHTSQLLWVSRQQLRELDALEKAIREVKGEIAAYLEGRYGAQWSQHFEGKSKKAIWAELTDDGSEYPQLATFYAHVRDDGLAHILRGYLRYDNVARVSCILRLDDAELVARVTETGDLEGKAAALNELIIERGFY